MEGEGVWRLVSTYPNAFDSGDTIFQYELCTATEHGDALYSSKGKSWSINIIGACGFCLDWHGTPCPHHPVRYQEPVSEVGVGYPASPKPLPSVPLEHAGKAAREQAVEQAAREPVFK